MGCGCALGEFLANLFFFFTLTGSYEHSPRLLNHQFRAADDMGSDLSISTGDSQLREELADAMRESPGRHSRDSTGECCFRESNIHNIIVYSRFRLYTIINNIIRNKIFGFLFKISFKKGSSLKITQYITKKIPLIFAKHSLHISFSFAYTFSMQLFLHI